MRRLRRLRPQGETTWSGRLRDGNARGIACGQSMAKAATEWSGRACTPRKTINRGSLLPLCHTSPLYRWCLSFVGIGAIKKRAAFLLIPPYSGHRRCERKDTRNVFLSWEPIVTCQRVWPCGRGNVRPRMSGGSLL